MHQAAGRPFIIVNYFASRARRAWHPIKSILAQNDIGFDVHETSAAGEAEACVRSALRDGHRIVAAVGGDGTLSEVTRGFFECPTAAGAPPAPINPEAALSILPAGTGDDFARGLTGHREPLEKWVARLVAYCRSGGGDVGKGTRDVDALYATVSDDARSFICLNAATLGISADVTTRVTRQGSLMRRLPGETRFIWAAVGALTTWRNRMVRITVDESSMECATNLMAVVNGRYVGGGMKFVPSARPDDGFLEAIVACDMTRMQAVRELTRIHRGGHLANPKIVLQKGGRVRVETLDPAEAFVVEADGDVRGQTPAEFRLMPGALRLIW
ncbi:MAG: diacylglycerol kinase family protein [Pyrinomonadaceae bacterium]